MDNQVLQETEEQKKLLKFLDVSPSYAEFGLFLYAEADGEDESGGLLAKI